MKDDSSPAFPTDEENDRNGYHYEGMTLRDWFAGQALAGILSTNMAGATYTDIAREAHGYAEAMLFERNK